MRTRELNHVRPAFEDLLARLRTDHVELGKMCIRDRPEDLLDQPLISSRQGVKVGVLGQWLGDLADEMDVRATYNLPLNAKFLVRQGIGSAFTCRGLFEANELNDLAFVPLSPTLESTQGLVWRKTDVYKRQIPR